MKRFYSWISLFLFPFLLQAYPVTHETETCNKWFEQIRNNEALLTSFLQQMPKGGDLHNHFTGSIYAESYLQAAINKNFYLSLKDYTLVPATSVKDSNNYVAMKKLSSRTDYYAIRNQLWQLWSMWNYYPGEITSKDRFFNTFSYFNGLDAGNEVDLLHELLVRAKAENQQYLETMYKKPKPSDYNPDLLIMDVYANKRMLELQGTKDTKQLTAFFDTLSSAMQQNRQLNADITDFVHSSRKTFDVVQKQIVTEDLPTLRFQTYVVRVVEPYNVFTQLYMSFNTCTKDTIWVGVNIVAPEDNEISMRDDWLHMQMFAYFHKKYPNVQYSIHAGELCLGLVKPEDLTYHIRDAVKIAQTKRIGHGVDLPYEQDCFGLLKKMQEDSIAVEINLVSNEQILGITGSAHPITMYYKAGVPIVISSDDMGVSRSNLLQQYLYLAQRYPSFSYIDIKKFIYNSIRYSFTSNKEKQILTHTLDQQFNHFESTMNTIAIKATY